MIYAETELKLKNFYKMSDECQIKNVMKSIL